MTRLFRYLMAFVLVLLPGVSQAALTNNATSMATNVETSFDAVAPISIGIAAFLLIFGLVKKVLRKA